MRTALWFLSLLCGCSLVLRADEINWTNSMGGDWNNASNWDLGRVPSTGDQVWITNSGTYTVTLTTNATVVSLTLGAAGGTQTLDLLGATIYSTGPMTIRTSGYVFADYAVQVFRGMGYEVLGSISADGPISVDGALAFSDSAGANQPFGFARGIIGGTGALYIGPSGRVAYAQTYYGPVQNAGLITMEAGTFWGGLTNLASGVVQLTRAPYLPSNEYGVDELTGPTFINSGTLRVSNY